MFTFLVARSRYSPIDSKRGSSQDLAGSSRPEHAAEAEAAAEAGAGGATAHAPPSACAQRVDFILARTKGMKVAPLQDLAIAYGIPTTYIDEGTQKRKDIPAGQLRTAFDFGVRKFLGQEPPAEVDSQRFVGALGIIVSRSNRQKYFQRCVALVPQKISRCATHAVLRAKPIDVDCMTGLGICVSQGEAQDGRSSGAGRPRAAERLPHTFAARCHDGPQCSWLLHREHVSPCAWVRPVLELGAQTF